MLAGIQELLTIGFIIVCLFFIPRLFRGSEATVHKRGNPYSRISGRMRFGIVLSFALPLGVAVILKPWEGSFPLFLSVGIFPVAVGWAGVWVKNGFKNSRGG